jgi:hypothetical protein
MTDNATHNGFRLGFGMRKFEFQEFREKMIRTILGPFLMAFFAMIGSTWASVSASAQSISADEARTIAKEAYIYGFPLVDSYRVQYSYFVDRGNPEFKVPWNTLSNTARVYTPDDKAIQTPNSDTPYSFLGADLRAEPLVLTVPAIEEERYYSLQFIDMYTFNFAYVGSRATGNDGGSFLLAGPDWKGETPPGVKSVIRAETEFAFVLYRTQLFNRERQEDPGWVQGTALIAVPWQTCTKCTGRHRLHQTAQPGGGENLTRFFQDPQLRIGILPAKPCRKRNHGSICRFGDWPSRDLRSSSAQSGNAQSRP